MKTLGLDVGFGFTKVVTGDGKGKFPSVTGSYEENMLQDSGIKPIETEQESVFVGSDRFMVGSLAVQRSERIYTTREKNWIETPAYKALVKYACRVAGLRGNEKVRIITGLPVGHFRRCKSSLVKTVKEVIGLETDVRVILQPLGSYFDCLLDDNAIVKDKEFLMSRTGIIDIGFFTIDFVTMQNLNFIKNCHESHEGGLSSAYRRIARHLYDVFDYKKEVYEMEPVVRDGFVKVFGEKRDVKKTVERTLDELADEIEAKAKILWKEGSDIDFILVTGGGANALKGRFNFYKHMRFVHDSQFANARGYFKYGRRLAYA